MTEVEENYDGYKLEKTMTKEFIDDMIVRFKNNKRIDKKYVYRILWDIKTILMLEPTMVELSVAHTDTLTICGDTHGTLSFGSYRPILRCFGDIWTQWIPLVNAPLPL
jgi:hypothetical protein